MDTVEVIQNQHMCSACLAYAVQMSTQSPQISLYLFMQSIVPQTMESTKLVSDLS